MFDDTRGGDGDGGGGFGFFGFGGRTMHYILDGREVKPCRDFMAWARWYEHADRKVAATHYRGLWISTVFLGLDSSMSGPPRLFETAIFVGRGSMADCWRACTWADAVKTHRIACATARAARSGRERARHDWETRGYLRERFRYQPETDD